MKQLYLVRHAKSSWELEYLDDFERPLNERGKRDAPLMGRVLREREIRPDVICASPAARAASTARIVAAELGYPLENIRYREHLYDPGVPDFIEALSVLNDSINSAMIVSHNPGITMAAHFLTADELISEEAENGLVDIPTAGIVAIEFDVESWKGIKGGTGRILFVESPKKRREER